MGCNNSCNFFSRTFFDRSFKSTYVSNELDIWVDVFDQSSLYTYTLDHDYDTTVIVGNIIFIGTFFILYLPHLSHDYKVDYFQNAGLNYLGTKREFISKAMFSDRTHTESFDQDVHYFRLTFLYKEPNDHILFYYHIIQVFMSLILFIKLNIMIIVEFLCIVMLRERNVFFQIKFLRKVKVFLDILILYCIFIFK
jgi:hypothetical protein